MLIRRLLQVVFLAAAAPPACAIVALQLHPPLLHAQFATTVRASSGYGGAKGTPIYPNPPGFNGDGCVRIRSLLTSACWSLLHLRSRRSMSGPIWSRSVA